MTCKARLDPFRISLVEAECKVQIHMNSENGRDHSCDKAVQGGVWELNISDYSGVDSDKDTLAQNCVVSLALP